MEQGLKFYKIPCTWQCCGEYEIMACSLTDAIALAEEKGFIPLGQYIEDSLEIDIEGVKLTYPNETNREEMNECE